MLVPPAPQKCLRRQAHCWPDNGLGVDPQYFDRIFGMLQGLHQRDDFVGTGIGLAVCKKIVEVLTVEDSPGDVRVTREGLRDAGLPVNLHVANDGVEAMAFLKREGDHANAPRPDFILLDLNLPKMDGREVLELIKQDEELKTIPTVVPRLPQRMPTS